MNIVDVRNGMCTAVKAGTAIKRAFPYLRDQVSPPSFFVGEASIDYHKAFGRNGLAMVTFTAWLVVSRANDRTGPEELDQYLTQDDGGAGTALEADQSLGGTASAVIVRNARTAEVTIGGTSYFGVQFTVEVYA